MYSAEIEVLLSAERRQTNRTTIQGQRLQLSISALQALVVETLPGVKLSVFWRSAVEDELKILSNPEAVASPLQGDPFHQTAILEWKQVLDSPFSPVRLLEDALSRDWDELPASPENIMARLLQLIEEQPTEV